MSAIMEITKDKLDRELAAVDWSDQKPIDRPEAAICVRGLRKCYGKLEAVRGVDLEIGRGEIFGVIGPDDAESVQWQLGLTDKETYTRPTVSVGDASITIYIHDSLAPTGVLSRMVESYMAWAIHQPGGRR